MGRASASGGDGAGKGKGEGVRRRTWQREGELGRRQGRGERMGSGRASGG